MMEVIIIQPNEGPKLIELEGDLDSFQEAVGGYIEAVALKGITGAFAYVNEEGKPRGLMPNTFATSLAELPPGEVIRGPMVIFGDRGDGNETNVPGLIIDSVFDARRLELERDEPTENDAMERLIAEAAELEGW